MTPRNQLETRHPSPLLTPAAISELLDRLEAAEKSDAESIAMYRTARDERDALRARIEEMEKQEPVAWARKLGLDVPSFGCVTDLKYRPSDIPESAYVPLYAIPVAQPAPSISPVALRHVIQWLRNGCDPMKAADELEMLAAAPEAKP